MKFNSIHFPKMMLSVLCAMALVSCSKDNDLLADYVINEDNTLITETKIVDDTFAIGLNQSIVLDVLSNDNFQASSTVTIVSVTQPNYGTVVINEDNTLTYTPYATAATSGNTNEEDAGSNSEETAENDPSNDSEESGDTTTGTNETNGENQGTGEQTTEDSFDYTTEETNEAGETNTDEGTVTVTTEESKIPTSGDNVFFVTTSGSGNNDGLSEETAWSWKYAVANAKPGMIIYVKAGEYNNYNTRLTVNGTQEQPIRFIGYKNNPGDINAFKQELLSKKTNGRRGTTRLAGNVKFDYKTAPSSEEMPYFFKAYLKNDPPAFEIGGDYTEIHNIIVHGYDVAFRLKSSSQGAKIVNTITKEQGNMNVDFYDGGHSDRYNGTGYSINGATDFQIIFNTNLNSEQNAFQMLGCQNGEMTNNLSYSYNLINGTDYNFLLTSLNSTPTTGITLEYNTVIRDANVTHSGHAFVAKNGANNNQIKNFAVINSSIEVNFANVFENIFEDGTIKAAYYTDRDPYGSIFQTNGAHHNIFKNIVVDGAWGGIISHDYDDGASSDPNRDATEGGINNFFVNIIVKNSKYAVIYSETGVNSPGSVKDNLYLNCTFYNVEFGIRAYMQNSNNKFYNCSFNTENSLYTNHENINLNQNTIFENCHFDGGSSVDSTIGFIANNNIEGKPMFVDTNSLGLGGLIVSGLMLQENSPLNNSGLNVTNILPNVIDSFNGSSRNDSFNIGAF